MLKRVEGRVAALAVVAVALAGCATNMNGRVSMEVDPDYPVDKSMVVLVQAADYKDANLMRTKFYLDRIASSVRAMGFASVYTPKSVPAGFTGPDVYVFANLDSKSESYQYTSNDYGMVDSGRSTTDCTGFGSSISCTHRSKKEFDVVGRSQKTAHFTNHYLSLGWLDAKSKKQSAFGFLSASNSECSDEKNYDLLIDEGIKRLPLDRPSKHVFQVQMPHGFCK